MVAILVPIFLALIFGIPALLALSPLFLWKGPLFFLAAFFSPAVFSLAFVLTAAALSRTGVRAIIPGFFPRDLRHKIYGPRRLHSLCWTSLYYFTPLYFAVLSVPQLKHVVLRLFGYRGSTKITLYPDVWMRDLPLLDIADGVYVANRATLGSNICTADGRVYVDRLKIGPHAMVGHMALMAPGSKLGENAELGVHTAIGIRARMEAGSKTGPCVVIHHRASIGAGTDIGCSSYIGTRSKIGAGLVIAPGANIPPDSQILSQDQADSQHAAFLTQLRHTRLSTARDLFEGVTKESLRKKPALSAIKVEA